MEKFMKVDVKLNCFCECKEYNCFDEFDFACILHFYIFFAFEVIAHSHLKSFSAIHFI